MTAPMLEIQDLVGGYGNVQILNGASLKVDTGAIVALLGGNGTGKSTLLQTVSGLKDEEVRGDVRSA